ncbi:helix-turn-helix domain-containing protein [Marinicella litoralis]|uniref:Cytoskeletal protein RodZ n=1 Tax=Marinicella litoralis TaxID=644220 RepID=A0A4R6XGH4_9GAMM|nr:RodZ domain-containing protein [Marinicella litoralis]TDR16844.1 cytoskeletal protein RodZ [Marinicella litoralis]
MNTESTNTINITELAAIRNKKNVTIEALADTLKVSKDFIKSIESGAFEKLGAPTFVKGHVTNYCKALDLPIESVLQQIPEKYLQAQSLKPSDAMGASPLARVRRKSNYLGKYAVGTALLSMLALSFYFVWDKWSLPKNMDVQSLSLTASTLAEKNKPATKNITYSSMIPQVKLDDEQTSPDLGDEVGLIDSENESIQQSSEHSEGDTELNSGLDTVEDGNALDEQGSLQELAGYSIELQLAEEAWVSIKTNDGVNLEHDLVAPGTYTYHSLQPVHFRIGNATNSQVRINNNEINLLDFMKKDIADFSWPNDPS